MNWAKALIFVGVTCAAAVPAFSADVRRKAPATASTQQDNDIADVPGDDIFGFTSPSEVGEEGDKGIASENDIRVGKRDGRYTALGSKLEFSRNLAPNAWGAISFFSDWHRARDVTGIDTNVSRANFDGISSELIYRFVRREMQGEIFAASLSVEPRWARVDAVSGQRLNSFTPEVKLFVDAVLVPDRLFWALNLNYAPTVQQIAGDTSHWAATSGSNVSTALTYAIVKDRLFVGVEARYLAAFNRAFLNNKAGEALFLGPNALYKITSQVALSAAWTPQIAGKSQALRDRTFDLDNFERHQMRVKLAVGF